MTRQTRSKCSGERWLKQLDKGLDTDMKNIISTPRDPAVNAYAITPSDSDVLTFTRGLWIGTGGDLAVVMSQDEDAVTFANVPSGVMLPFAVSKVMSTNTTASGIVGVK